MKISLFTIAFLFSVQLNAQWSGAIMDTLTFNSERDEVNHQSFSIDRSEMLHLVYSRENQLSGWNIFYKKRGVNAVWSSEEIVTSQIGNNPVITASNIPGEAFIAFEFSDTLSKEIYICSNTGGTWNCSQLTSDSLNDTWPSIAVDSAGFLHVAWIVENNDGKYKIKYATNLSGSWIAQELTGSQLGQYGSGASPEMVVDKRGYANIAYRGDNSNGFRIHYARNQFPGDTIWTYEIISTPNDQDLSFAILVDVDTVAHLLICGNDAFSLPLRAYYHYKTFSAISFSPSMEVAPAFHGQAGDLFVDKNNNPHIVLNEVNGNIYTGNIIYANSDDWNGIVLLNSGDIYNANLVIDSEYRAYLAAYRGNIFSEEEVIIYGSDRPVIIGEIKNNELPFKIISTENNLIIHFLENYSGRFSCTSVDGKTIFDSKKNYFKGEAVSIVSQALGFYIIYLENEKGKIIQKVFWR